MGGYSTQHWDKQIAKYLSKDWSFRPSPFAQLAKEHFPVQKATILELGTGAGQDGLWFASEGCAVTLSDGTDQAFDEIASRASRQNISGYSLEAFDITQPFPFDDESFDVVYAQLVLHYFDNEAMHRIMAEIARVLRPNGIVAIMVNTIQDEEYDGKQANDEQIIVFDGISKRYFSVESLRPFVAQFKTRLLDNKGKTPKDDAVGNSGMIQFIGEKGAV